METKKRGLTNEGRKNLIAYAILMPSIIVFLVFKYFPIAAGIFASFFKVSVINFPGDFVGWGNYARAFTDARFGKALLVNLITYVYGLVMGFWPPILCAFLINEMRRGKTFFRVAYFIPAIGTAASGAVLWRYVWNPDYGLANFIIKQFGFGPQMWLNSPQQVYFCMGFPALVVIGGMNMLIYLAAFQDIPESQIEAALLDGAGLLKRFRYIAWPAIKPIISTMFLLNLIGSFNSYENYMMVTDGGPMGATTVSILYAYKIATQNSDYGYAITISTLIFALVLVLTIIQMYLDGRSED